jgi:hypothetical protein
MRKKNDYSSVPRGYGICIYAAVMGNGLVKVGYSRNPRTRLGSLCAQSWKRFGTRIQKFHVSPVPSVQEAMQAEAELIAALACAGNQVSDAKEYFWSVSFGYAVNLVKQKTTVRKFYPHIPASPASAQA